MEERQEQQVEITFRLSAGLLGELARLVAAVSGGENGAGRETAAPAPEAEPAHSPEETVSRSFDFARFQELSAQAAEPDLPQRERAQAEPALPSRAAEGPAPETAPPEYAGASVETDAPAPERREARAETGEPRIAPPAFPALPAGGAAGTAAADPEALSRRFERDSRRYDGGFPLY